MNISTFNKKIGQSEAYHFSHNDLNFFSQQMIYLQKPCEIMAQKLTLIEKSVSDTLMKETKHQSNRMYSLSDVSKNVCNKKKNKKKSKKEKSAEDEVDLLLESCIADNMTWPKQIEKAIGSIRRVTYMKENDIDQLKS